MYSSVHSRIDAMQIVHDTTKRLSYQQKLRLPESVLVSNSVGAFTHKANYHSQFRLVAT